MSVYTKDTENYSAGSGNDRSTVNKGQSSDLSSLPSAEIVDGQHLALARTGRHSRHVSRFTTVASWVKGGLHHVHAGGYRSWVETGGLVAGGAGMVFGAPSIMTSSIFAGTIVAGKALSYFGGPVPPGSLWRRPRAKIYLPMSIEQREDAIAYVENHFNNIIPAKLMPREQNPFWTPIPRASVLRNIFEQSNPFSGFVVSDEKKDVHGLILLFPMRTGVLKALMRGSLAFGSLQADDVLSKPDEQGALYVDIFNHRLTPPWLRGTSEKDLRNIIAGLHGAAHILDRHYLEGENRSRQLTLYALEKHKTGCKLLLQLGFAQDDTLTKARRDDRKVFLKVINRSEISRLRSEWDINERDVDIIYNRNLIRRTRPSGP